MPADLIHLVRHGEVYNPNHVLYGRLPGFGLSELGKLMAKESADSLVGHPVTRLYASPLQRTQESAAPWAADFGLPIITDERLIEPWNLFEGTAGFGARALRNPRLWPKLRNPFRPSWGEPYASIVARMLSVIEDAWNATESGEVVLVSHQLPIWMVHRALAGERLFHDPRKRRCALSSITTLAHRPSGPSSPSSPSRASGTAFPTRTAVPSLRDAPEPASVGPGTSPGAGTGTGAGFVEVDYQDPAAALQSSAIDLGAV